MNNDAIVPPYSTMSEQAVLGSVMISEDALDKAVELLKPEDFYFTSHIRAFKVIAQMYEANEKVDVLTVSERISSSDDYIQESTILADLAGYVNNLPSAANVETYIHNIKERALLRRIGTLGYDVTQSAFARNAKSDVVLNLAESKLLDITQSYLSESETIYDTVTGLDDTLTKLQTILERGDSITGLPTGFASLDKKTMGLQPGELTIIAARPSMGKTCLSLNICNHIIGEVDKPILYMSVEMPVIQLYQRIMAADARVPFSIIRTADLDDIQWGKLSNTIKRLKETNLLYVDESNPLTPMQLRSRARRLAKQYQGLSMIVVDYLQLMHSPAFLDNRNLEIADISRSLKSLAKELNIPVVALAQLNRGLEGRANKRPTNADLRDSGSLEQDADLIMFIYRDEVYDEHTDDKGIAEIIIGKNRNGETGTVKLHFSGEYQLFSDTIGTGS